MINWDVGPDEVVHVPLTHEEWDLLRQGVLQAGGPTALTSDVARVVGYQDLREMFDDWRRLLDAIKAAKPLTKRDWQRALVATEIVWASSVYGAGDDWEIVTGDWDDERTRKVLRQVQDKMIGLRAPRERLR